MKSLITKPVFSKNVLICQRTFHASLSLKVDAPRRVDKFEQRQLNKNLVEEEIDPEHPPVRQVDTNDEIPKNLDELSERFNEIFHMPEDIDDLGVERHERLTRKKMKRVAVFREDFATLEENHILFGDMGTPNKPVQIESDCTTRIVGCQGSSSTRQHSVLWHLVKREKPCICLECGQVFQLVSPVAGSEIYPWVDAHH